MSNIQLHVGYIGITREGKRVEITELLSGDGTYPWGSTYATYTNQGFLIAPYDSPLDIIGPWVETPVEPQVNYNDGNWHRWDGTAADGPVHGDSTVQVRLLNPTDEYGDMTGTASGWWWEQPCNCPIVAFRVTKEYVAPVEPREFWIELDVMGGVCKTHKIKTRDFLGTTLVLVREVV